MKSTAGNLYYFLRNSLKCKHPVDTNLRFFWCLLSSCHHVQCLSTHTILQGTRLTEPYSGLYFIFTEAKSENSSEQCSGRAAYENIAVILKLFKLRNRLTISNIVLKCPAKITHIPFTLLSSSDPERGHALFAHNKKGTALGIIQSLCQFQW